MTKEEAKEYIYDCLDRSEATEVIKAFEQQQEPSEDCISRQVVKEMLTETWTKYMPMELDINLSFVLDKISALPSVTPKPKIGKWIDDVIENEDTNLPIQVCSICKTFYPLSYTGGGHNYCPNCGAKMEVEDD